MVKKLIDFNMFYKTTLRVSLKTFAWGVVFGGVLSVPELQASKRTGGPLEQDLTKKQRRVVIKKEPTGPITRSQMKGARKVMTIETLKRGLRDLNKNGGEKNCLPIGIKFLRWIRSGKPYPETASVQSPQGANIAFHLNDKTAELIDPVNANQIPYYPQRVDLVGAASLKESVEYVDLAADNRITLIKKPLAELKHYLNSIALTPYEDGESQAGLLYLPFKESNITNNGITGHYVNSYTLKTPAETKSSWIADGHPAKMIKLDDDWLKTAKQSYQDYCYIWLDHSHDTGPTQQRAVIKEEKEDNKDAKTPTSHVSAPAAQRSISQELERIARYLEKPEGSPDEQKIQFASLLKSLEEIRTHSDATPTQQIWAHEGQAMMYRKCYVPGVSREESYKKAFALHNFIKNSDDATPEQIISAIGGQAMMYRNCCVPDVSQEESYMKAFAFFNFMRNSDDATSKLKINAQLRVADMYANCLVSGLTSQQSYQLASQLCRAISQDKRASQKQISTANGMIKQLSSLISTGPRQQRTIQQQPEEKKESKAPTSNAPTSAVDSINQELERINRYLQKPKGSADEMKTQFDNITKDLEAIRTSSNATPAQQIEACACKACMYRNCWVPGVSQQENHKKALNLNAYIKGSRDATSKQRIDAGLNMALMFSKCLFSHASRQKSYEMACQICFDTHNDKKASQEQRRIADTILMRLTPLLSTGSRQQHSNAVQVPTVQQPPAQPQIRNSRNNLNMPSSQTTQMLPRPQQVSVPFQRNASVPHSQQPVVYIPMPTGLSTDTQEALRVNERLSRNLTTTLNRARQQNSNTAQVLTVQKPPLQPQSRDPRINEQHSTIQQQQPEEVKDPRAPTSNVPNTSAADLIDEKLAILRTYLLDPTGIADQRQAVFANIFKSLEEIGTRSDATPTQQIDVQINLAFMYRKCWVSGVSRQDSHKKAFELYTDISNSSDATPFQQIKVQLCKALMYSSCIVSDMTKPESDKKAFDINTNVSKNPDATALQQIDAKRGLAEMYDKNLISGMTQLESFNKAFALLTEIIQSSDVTPERPIEAKFYLSGMYFEKGVDVLGMTQEACCLKAYQLLASVCYDKRDLPHLKRRAHELLDELAKVWPQMSNYHILSTAQEPPLHLQSSQPTKILPRPQQVSVPFQGSASVPNSPASVANVPPHPPRPSTSFKTLQTNVLQELNHTNDSYPNFRQRVLQNPTAAVQKILNANPNLNFDWESLPDHLKQGCRAYVIQDIVNTWNSPRNPPTYIPVIVEDLQFNDSEKRAIYTGK